MKTHIKEIIAVSAIVAISLGVIGSTFASSQDAEVSVQYVEFDEGGTQVELSVEDSSENGTAYVIEGLELEKELLNHNSELTHAVDLAIEKLQRETDETSFYSILDAIYRDLDVYYLSNPELFPTQEDGEVLFWMEG